MAAIGMFKTDRSQVEKDLLAENANWTHMANELNALLTEFTEGYESRQSHGAL